MEIKISKGNPVLCPMSLNYTTFTSLQDKGVKTFLHISPSRVQPKLIGK